MNQLDWSDLQFKKNPDSEHPSYETRLCSVKFVKENWYACILQNYL